MRSRTWLLLALAGAILAACGGLTLILGGLIALVTWLWSVRGYVMLVAAISLGYGIVMLLVAANRAAEQRQREEEERQDFLAELIGLDEQLPPLHRREAEATVES